MKNIFIKKKIKLIAKAALAKKAQNVVSLDMRKLSAICDYFIITSGDSITQIDTIADNIEKELSRHSCRLWHKEGNGEARWILLDYGEIVVHIFHRETRGFYNLEKLWHDAPRKQLKELIKKKTRRSVKKKAVKKKRKK